MTAVGAGGKEGAARWRERGVRGVPVYPPPPPRGCAPLVLGCWPQTPSHPLLPTPLGGGGGALVTMGPQALRPIWQLEQGERGLITPPTISSSSFCREDSITYRVSGVALQVTNRYQLNILVWVSMCCHVMANKHAAKPLGRHAIVRKRCPLHSHSMRF